MTSHISLPRCHNFVLFPLGAYLVTGYSESKAAIMSELAALSALYGSTLLYAGIIGLGALWATSPINHGNMGYRGYPPPYGYGRGYGGRWHGGYSGGYRGRHGEYGGGHGHGGFYGGHDCGQSHSGYSRCHGWHGGGHGRIGKVRSSENTKNHDWVLSKHDIENTKIGNRVHNSKIIEKYAKLGETNLSSSEMLRRKRETRIIKTSPNRRPSKLQNLPVRAEYVYSNHDNMLTIVHGPPYGPTKSSLLIRKQMFPNQNVKKKTPIKPAPKKTVATCGLRLVCELGTREHQSLSTEERQIVQFVK